MNTKATITALAVVSLGISAAQASTIAWGGGDGNWNTEGVADAGWSGGTSPTMDGTDDAVINGGTVSYDAGALGDLGAGWGSSHLTLNGGVLTQSTTHWSVFDGSGTFTIAGGTFNSAADRVQIGASGTDTAQFVMTSGSFIHTGSEVAVRGGNTFTVSGGSMSANFFSLGDFGLATIDVAGGTVRLNDGSSGGGFYIGTAGSAINLTAAGVFNIGNTNIADATANYLDTDRVVFGMDGNNALLQVVDDGAGGVNISAVPEPTSAALLGLGGVALILRRRK
ncbi:PEP-CTERM sorting domain-containing protein [Verrucomicrobiaceae bacterium N1E253]|uniref:PEP-CTERM sorting domain-containing protein n=1 Tax=Oceaniferula marina TaxID=2748318 RepID=A0A851GDZ5_9BACT|nr:PEP-CTERM sorting domain-containing protein [Oceaniferula marina]NWK55988.1 PEP-CTERM sorting domain-containing protein [Oceaniferula marina]